MERKSFLLKIIMLIVMLFFVVGIVLVVIRGSNNFDQSVSGQSFFSQFVLAGGPIVWFVLLPMSIALVSIALQQGFTIRRKNLLPTGIAGDIVSIIRQFGPGPLAVKLAGRKDFVSLAVLRAAAALDLGHDKAQLRDLLAESLQEQAFGLLRKIEWANIIGNVAPMVGLFGTVFGMIKAFNGIVIAGGQPQPAHLAGGISIALVTTFWGLLVAIPALAIHGVFRHRIETLTSQAAIEAQFVLSEMASGLSGRDGKDSTHSLPTSQDGQEDSTRTLPTVKESKLKTPLKICDIQNNLRHYKPQIQELKSGTKKLSSRSNEDL